MNSKLYVGNLSFSTTEERLHTVFSEFGAVTSVRMIMDRETGRFRGFAFVEMADQTAAQATMQALDNQTVDGRRLRVNFAEERAPRGNGGGGYQDRPRRNAEY